jgi:hypothetical protein
MLIDKIDITPSVEYASMSANLDMTVIEMVRQWPVRSAVNIIGPQIFSLAQFANSYYNDISLVYPAVFAVLLVCMSVLVLQRQWAVFCSVQLNRNI